MTYIDCLTISECLYIWSFFKMLLFWMHVIVYMFLPLITQIFIWLMKGQWLMHRDPKINSGTK